MSVFVLDVVHASFSQPRLVAEMPQPDSNLQKTEAAIVKA